MFYWYEKIYKEKNNSTTIKEKTINFTHLVQKYKATINEKFGKNYTYLKRKLKRTSLSEHNVQTIHSKRMSSGY